MLKRAILARLATIMMFMASVISPLSAQAVVPGTSIPDTVTHLIVSNPTSQQVTIYVTLEANSIYTEDGCTNSVGDIVLVDQAGGNAHQSLTGSGTQGTYVMPAGSSYELVSTLTNPHAAMGIPTEQNCLQGIEVTFGAAPSCPIGGVVPNGVNGGEPTLNMPGTINGATGGNAGVGEACDITCVNGANSLIQLSITSPMGDPQAWIYDVSKQVGSSFTTSNSWVSVAGGCDDNCSPERPGVYPFGCTQCNKFPDPAPPCGQFCASENGLAPNKGCNFGRSPYLSNMQTAQYGGTLTYTYLGPAHPPASCAGTNAGQEAKISRKRAEQQSIIDRHAWKQQQQQDIIDRHAWKQQQQQDIIDRHAWKQQQQQDIIDRHAWKQQQQQDIIDRHAWKQ